MLVITVFGVEEIPSHKPRKCNGDITAELILGTPCNMYRTVHGVLVRPVTKNDATVKTSSNGNYLKT
jgi:hypothetical protein